MNPLSEQLNVGDFLFLRFSGFRGFRSRFELVQAAGDDFNIVLNLLDPLFELFEFEIDALLNLIVS